MAQCGFSSCSRTRHRDAYSHLALIDQEATAFRLTASNCTLTYSTALPTLLGKLAIVMLEDSWLLVAGYGAVLAWSRQNDRNKQRSRLGSAASYA